MRNFFKKLVVLSLLVLPMAMYDYDYVFAYSDQNEETSNVYTEEMENEVKGIVDEITKSTQYLLRDSNRFTVVLDPGHGGSDPGASGNGIVEKIVNLDIAKAVKDRLQSYGINVVMTREADLASNKKLELSQRAAIANEINADLFVSLHNDSGGGDGAHVIHSINEGMSKILATNIANSIKNNTSQNLKKYNPIWSRSYVDSNGKTVDYYGVIRMSKMPAVIVEHAFLDNSHDIEAINTPEKIKVMGYAVADGIYKTIEDNFGFWKEVDGSKFYYDHNGNITTGWLNYHNSGTWYYFNEEGVMQTGWEYIDGSWYYLRSNGVMATGWEEVDGKWYYLKLKGMMAIGWEYIDGSWYYLKSRGDMAIGWEYIDGSWYYLRSKGIMATGWEKVDGSWYYLKPKGVMAIGWEKVNGRWYYLTHSGAMATGWLDLNGKKYYLKEDGSMVTGSIKIGSKTYNFSSSGELIK